MPRALALAVPVQVVYADDSLYPASDLEGEERVLTLKRSLPMVKNKATTLVGTEPAERVSRAFIATCENERKGKFKIKLNGAVIYETTEEFTVPPFSLKFFDFNKHDDNGAVTAIPFVPGTPGVPGDNKLFWAPLRTFEFKGPARTAEITVEFGNEEIGKTIVEKLINTVPFRVMWKALVLDGHALDSQLTERLVSEARFRSQGPPEVFMKANLPVEDPQFQPRNSEAIGVFDGGTLTQWQNQGTDARVNKLYKHLATRALSLKVIGLDRMILVVQDGFLKGISDKVEEPVGLAVDGEKVVVVKINAEFPVDTHEIGHTKPFFLTDDYKVTGGQVTDRGRIARGYLAAFKKFGRTINPARPVTANDADDTFGYMGVEETSRLVARKDQYRFMASLYFDKDVNPEIDPKLWLLRGVLKKDNSAFTLDTLPIYTFKSTTNPIAEPCNSNPDCTTLTLRMKLDDDTEVQRVQNFRLGGDIDYAQDRISNIGPVSDAVELPQGGKIKEITILDENAQILFTKAVSPEKPHLKILKKDSSLLTEVTEEDDEEEVDMGEESIKSLKIRGTDQDGNTLHASLFIIDKDGNMDEIELDKPANGVTIFDIETRFLTPGNYKLLVLLTDGFNTVQKKVKVRI